MPLCESTGFQTGGARMGHTPRPHASPSPAMCSGERFIMSLSCCVLSLDCIQDHLRPSWGRLISSRKGTCIYKTHTHIHTSNRGEKQLDKSETSCRTQELRNCFFIFFVPRFYVAPMEKSLNYLSQMETRTCHHLAWNVVPHPATHNASFGDGIHRATLAVDLRGTWPMDRRLPSHAVQQWWLGTFRWIPRCDRTSARRMALRKITREIFEKPHCLALRILRG